MHSHGWYHACPELAAVLASRWADGASTTDVIADHEEALRIIWSYSAMLLGDGGISAILTRVISVAARDISSLQYLRIVDSGVSFAEFRDRGAGENWDDSAVKEALVCLTVILFRSLSELTGDILTKPLLEKLTTHTPVD